MLFFACQIQGCVLLAPPNLKVSTFNFEIFAFYAQHISNVYQMCIFQIFYKCFTNLFQMSNLSFFVNSRDKLIHSLAAFSLINISIAIYHYSSGASAATQRVSMISKSSRYLFIAYIYANYILTDPSRSCQIFPDLHIFQQISKDHDRSQQISTDLSRSRQILADLHKS